MKINVKPLTANHAWRGGPRYRTNDYKSYEEELFYLLPKKEIPKGRLFITLTFGLSNKLSDVDNPIKPFLDVLQKKYDFNDNRIYVMDVAKEDVKKGKEYIEFEIFPMD